MVTGAGSGGHITPVLAVAEQLKKLDSSLRIVYIGQRGDSLGDTVTSSPAIDSIKTIWAGKFRRYHGEGWRQMLDLKTMFLNLRDMFRVAAGLLQAFWLLRHERPAAIFIKGGFVGVPVGLAAAVLRIPYVTHDSDAIPGLANRVISRWAHYHAVALAADLYSYPAHKTVTVGVPVSARYQAVTAAQQQGQKRTLGIGVDAKLMLVTGGGLGAARLNQAMLSVCQPLMSGVPGLCIVHTVGRGNEEAMRAGYADQLEAANLQRVTVLGYTTDLSEYSAAADLVLTRAGATAIAELAVQNKACLIVPSPFLAGGHQLKNAEALEKAQAVAVLADGDLANEQKVLQTLVRLLQDDAERQRLASNLHAMAHPQAAQELAKLIMKTAERK